MKVLFVTSEIAPWVKTGGLGDVAAALPPALRQTGIDVRVLAPYYPALRRTFPDAAAPIVATFGGFGAHFAGSALREAMAPDGTPLLLLDSLAYFDRPGNPYLGPEGHDWLDNHLRFGLLSRIAAWLGSEDNFLPWHPDVLHCNDWQSALAPAYLRLLPGGRAHSIVTVHNLAFQGLFGQNTLHEVGLPTSAWAMDGVEYYGYLSFLKAGLYYADAITTVSPSYAAEIQTDAEGMGLAGLLRDRAADLTGILNGIDTAAWDPAHDAHLPFAYDARRLPQKQKIKAALQQEMGLAVRDDIPLLGIVSRLTHQKGLDLVPMIQQAIAKLPAQLVVLGSGERGLEDLFRELASLDPANLGVRIGFDEGLAHRIEAGADMFLMPSRFEPCGLNQMYSLRYGTPPIVRATGGLADTVIDGVNGFSFLNPTAETMLATIERAVKTWHNKADWRRLQEDGMSRDVGWSVPARRYAALYEHLSATL
jgi:starch synthase